MAKIADAERHPGNAHWSIYDGKGGVYHATRNGRTWTAYRSKGQGPAHYTGATLREVRQRIAKGAE